MSSEELRQFVMYFERLTRHMLEDMPAYADTVIDIDAAHRFVAAVNRTWAYEAKGA
jgi:D-glycerate 3-kinase